MVALTESELAIALEAAEFFEDRVERVTNPQFRRAIEEAAVNWRKVADAAQAHADRDRAVV